MGRRGRRKENVDHLRKLQVGKADIVASNDLVPRSKPCISSYAAHLHTLHEDSWLLRWPLANAVGMKGKVREYTCVHYKLILLAGREPKGQIIINCVLDNDPIK